MVLSGGSPFREPPLFCVFWGVEGWGEGGVGGGGWGGWGLGI